MHAFQLTSHHRHHVMRLIERKNKTERKISQGSTMQALRSHNSDDESMKHPNIVAWNPGLITQDASQTAKHLLGRRKKEQLKLLFFFPEIGWWGRGKETLTYLLTGKQEVVFPEELNQVRTKFGFIIGCRAHSGLSRVHTELRKATRCHPAELECLVRISYLWASRVPCVNLRYGNEAQAEAQPVKAHLLGVFWSFFCFPNKNLILASFSVWLFGAKHRHDAETLKGVQQAATPSAGKGV